MDYERLPPSRTLHNDSKHTERIPSDHRRLQQAHSGSGGASSNSNSKSSSHVPLNSNVEDKDPPRHTQTLLKNQAQLGPYDLSHPHTEFTRHIHEFYRNQHIRDALPGHMNRSSSEPAISKLDLEEKRKSEERLNGVYASSESESDSEEELEDKRERHRRRMIRIVKRSRLKMDANEKKFGFLNTMGLITHKDRRGKDSTANSRMHVSRISNKYHKLC